jgi:hypothetical protein
MKSKKLSVITRKRLLVRLLLLSKNADSRKRKKKKLLVLEKCKKRQRTDSQRSMPSVPNVPLKKVSVKHVRRKLPSVKSNRGKQTSLRLLANANSLNGKQLWQTKPRPSVTTSCALLNVKKRKKRRSANLKMRREML